MHRSTRPSNRFLRRSTPFYACIFFLACLVFFNIALLMLQTTHFFEKHLFDLRKISAISQITSITTQASTVMILITLSYAMQIASSDNIIRRRQTVAALHDNLMAWRGLGSSILALLRSRKLDIPSRLRILLAFMFFGGVSVLHIVTPSVITIGTFNATIPVSLNVSTILDIQSWMGLVTWRPSPDPMTALPYLWSQLDTNTSVGLPAGVNGSVIFSTLPLIMTEDVIFQDPFARDLSVRCGIIPRVSGDSFQVSYVGPVNDILISLYESDGDSAAAFAYISTRNDSLRLDPSLAFAPPVQYNLQAQTWSFINNDTKNAFLEDVNATFYIWPIGCSLFAQNITAHVWGDNTLLWRNITHTPTDNPTPFLWHDIPHDPLEITWGHMIVEIYVSQTTMFPSLYLEDFPQFLTTFEHQLGSGLNSTNDSLALLGERLSSMTALSYTLLAHTYRSSPDSVPQFIQGWSPVFATVSGSQSILMAGLVVQTLPLILGIVTCSILIFVFAAVARPSTSSNNVLQDGQVINMVSILHNSSLSTVIPNSNEDLQRIQAMHTHVL
ncbi:hypothetical protein BS47DRAFT_1394651 [Hydnum rufescens UP504]|uniref:Uncharacterized protein n=1 Tax=Hydnum rufescens UP504 TaxID=1448309 RepID=A0A9P6DUS8_9AGAM|nr:hypothetical protein BS47DRAFT_1394651 [Hydnum rufescens UP504]